MRSSKNKASAYEMCRFVLGKLIHIKSSHLKPICDKILTGSFEISLLAPSCLLDETF